MLTGYQYSLGSSLWDFRQNVHPRTCGRRFGSAEDEERGLDRSGEHAVMAGQCALRSIFVFQESRTSLSTHRTSSCLMMKI